MDQLFDNATFLESGRIAAQFYGDVDQQFFICRYSREIDVQEPQVLIDFVPTVVHAEADTVFLPGTAWRAVEAVEELLKHGKIRKYVKQYACQQCIEKNRKLHAKRAQFDKENKQNHKNLRQPQDARNWSRDNRSPPEICIDDDYIFKHR